MVASFIPGAAVYSTAIVNTEGMTQRQIKSSHLEEAVGSPPGRHAAGRSGLR